MKLQIASLFLGIGLLVQSAGAQGTKGVRQRRTKKEDNDGGDGGGGGEDRTGLQEAHACEPNGQNAIDYVNSFGMPEQGDEGCLADPVGGCPGGCCRFSIYFICDTDNTDPYAPCVCNDLTADPVVVLNPIAPVPVVNGTAAVNGTATSSDSGPTDPPLTLEQMQDQFPDILAAIEAQSGAIMPEGAEGDGSVLNAMGDDKDDKDSKDDKKKKDDRVSFHSLLIAV